MKLTPKQKQLLGTWQSDRRQTLKNNASYQRLVGRRSRRVASIFGKLKVTYTPRYVMTELDGYKTRERYEVVAEDEDKIVLRIGCEQAKKRHRGDKILAMCFPDELQPLLETITFRKLGRQDFYWIARGPFCECFEKL